MLKQATFFKKIKKKKLRVNDYAILVKLYQNNNLTKDQCSYVIKKYKRLHPYLTTACKVNKKGELLIKSIESMFKPNKKLSSLEALGENYKERLTEYIELFPKGKLPNKKYARGNKKSIEQNFIWFFQEFDYDWETILEATSKYIEEYRKDNFKFMRTAQYFVCKTTSDVKESDLATYCEAYLDGEIEDKIVFKKKVV